MKKILIILSIFLLTSCNKITFDISRPGDTKVDKVVVSKKKDAVKKEEKPKVITIGTEFKALKLNKQLDKYEDVLVTLKEVKKATDSDINLYNETHDKKIEKQNDEEIYKINYDIKLVGFKNEDKVQNGRISIEIGCENKDSCDQTVYYLKNSDNLKPGDVGNVTILILTKGYVGNYRLYVGDKKLEQVETGEFN